MFSLRLNRCWQTLANPRHLPGFPYTLRDGEIIIWDQDWARHVGIFQEDKERCPWAQRRGETPSGPMFNIVSGCSICTGNDLFYKLREHMNRSTNSIMLRKKANEPLPGLQNNFSFRWILQNYRFFYPSACMIPWKDRFSRKNSNSKITYLRHQRLHQPKRPNAMGKSAVNIIFYHYSDCSDHCKHV